MCRGPALGPPCSSHPSAVSLTQQVPRGRWWVRLGLGGAWGPRGQVPPAPDTLQSGPCVPRGSWAWRHQQRALSGPEATAHHHHTGLVSALLSAQPFVKPHTPVFGLRPGLLRTTSLALMQMRAHRPHPGAPCLSGPGCSQVTRQPQLARETHSLAPRARA